MASYGYTFQSGDGVTPTRLNAARTVSDIVNADIKSDAAIALSKLATGALPSAITVASANLVDGTIVNADINASAAIAGTKIAPDFGSQDLVTAGRAYIRHTSSVSAFGVPPGLQLASTAQSGGAHLSVVRCNNDSSGCILSLAKGRNTSVAQGAIVQSGDEIGTIVWAADDGTDLTSSAASIRAFVDGTPGTNDMPGRLVFSTTADGVSSPAERMRITSSGNVGIGTTTPSSLLTVNGTASATTFRTGSLLSVGDAGTEEGALMLSNSIQVSRDQSICGSFRRTTSNGVVLQFYRDTTTVGTISVTTTATAYNTSSDYRLKENATPLASGLTTISQLAPCEFTWKSDGSTGRGFIAHELQAVVPEAVTGERDAVDADGNPQYQGVDASKLVPYLVSAVKELKARVEALEAA